MSTVQIYQQAKLSQDADFDAGFDAKFYTAISLPIYFVVPFARRVQPNQRICVIITMHHQCTIKTGIRAGIRARQAQEAGVRLPGCWDVVEFFEAIKSIGPWTVNYLAMRGLSDPDAFASADFGLINALIVNENKPTHKSLLALSENWRPWSLCRHLPLAIS